MKVIQMGRKHCGKRRNCSLRAVSPFPSVFKRLLQTRKNQGLFGKWLRVFIVKYMYLINYNTILILKVALQIFGRKFYKSTKESALYAQSFLNFIHRILVIERHPITREIRDLLWPMSTPTGNTVYFYMIISFIYILIIHRRSFKHGV